MTALFTSPATFGSIIRNGGETSRRAVVLPCTRFPQLRQFLILGGAVGQFLYIDYVTGSDK
jgi:hypothetical protein